MAGSGSTCACCGSADASGRFCARCGADSGDAARRNAYAVQPGEAVIQVAVISTLMPHTSRVSGNTYRWALIIATFVVVLFTVGGLLSAAVLSGALAVPIVYIVYLHDHGVGQPSYGALLGMIAITAILGVLVPLVFFRGVFDGQFGRLITASASGHGLADFPIGPFLLFSFVLPVVAMLAMNVGPIWLVRRPELDDMIDGLTFGVMAGTVYAAAESVVAFWPVFTAPSVRTNEGVAVWIPVILGLMIVKALLYGLSAGIAVAAYSGRGDGYDGFGPRYAAQFFTGVAALVVYWAGVRLFAYADNGQWFALVWGIAVVIALGLYARGTLHDAVLENALDDVNDARRPRAAVSDGRSCPECGAALQSDALFCGPCGQSVRATSELVRRELRVPRGGAG
jgi:hypothetical protein